MAKVKSLLPDEPEEGGQCPVDECKGTLELKDVEDCSCHISAPCAGHLNQVLECTECHEEFEW